MSDPTSDFATPQTTDAAKWAEGFMQTAWPRLSELDESEIESVMIGWFANAIETTRILDAGPTVPSLAGHFRVGGHSPVNIWLERDGEPDVQWAMARTDWQSAEMVRLANAGASVDGLIAAWDAVEPDDYDTTSDYLGAVVAATEPWVEALRSAAPDGGE